MVEKQKQM